MSEHDSECEIARLFEAQREADEALAPPFGEIVHRPARRSRSARSFRLIAAAASALVVTALVLLLHRARPPVPATESDGVALAAWKAPSDVLLQTPGSDLLNRTPILASPVPESIRTLPTQSKGGQG
jgi:hypothetical protein